LKMNGFPDSYSSSNKKDLALNLGSHNENEASITFLTSSDTEQITYGRCDRCRGTLNGSW